jgi:hypothetical protein
MWEALAVEGVVSRSDRLGIEATGVDGITMIPLSVQILSEAGKDVAVWLERDDPRSEVVIDQGFARCVIVYPDEPSKNNLERLISQSFSIDALLAGMTALATDRNDGWDEQVAELTRRGSSLIADRSTRQQVAGAADLTQAFSVLPEDQARELIAACLAAKSAPAPFEIKGGRAARIFTEALVAVDGVAEPFRQALLELGAWCESGPPRRQLRIDM